MALTAGSPEPDAPWDDETEDQTKRSWDFVDHETSRPVDDLLDLAGILSEDVDHLAARLLRDPFGRAAPPKVIAQARARLEATESRPHNHGVDVPSLSSGALLRLYADILTTLNHREVVRSRNAPCGDLAEVLASRVYRGKLAEPSVKSYDVLSADGRRLQVKARVITTGKNPGNYSPIRSDDFDDLVVVHFDADTYEVTWAVEVPWKEVEPQTTAHVWVGEAARRLTVNRLRAAMAQAIKVADEGGARSPFKDRTAQFAEQLRHLP